MHNVLVSVVAWLGWCVVATSVVATSAAAATYDPLAVAAGHTATWSDVDVLDASRSRVIPLRVYLPTTAARSPLILFSHGLGGSRAGSAYLGRHWSARGYVVVFLQHPGSDVSVWQDVPPARRMQALQKAASLDAFMQRVSDVAAVLDQLATWDRDTKHPLHGRFDLQHVGMSGHSFGAVTTQAVSGQTGPGGRQPFTDKRIDAAVVMSPSTPARASAAQSFGQVDRPWLLMTGTRDTAPIGNQDMTSRLAVFPALPEGGKYELVLDGAEHSVFTDRRLPGDAKPRNPAHHPAILAISTAFWDAWLKRDVAARAWLDGEAVRGVLVAADRWQKK